MSRPFSLSLSLILPFLLNPSPSPFPSHSLSLPLISLSLSLSSLALPPPSFLSLSSPSLSLSLSFSDVKASNTLRHLMRLLYQSRPRLARKLSLQVGVFKPSDIVENLLPVENSISKRAFQLINILIAGTVQTVNLLIQKVNILYKFKNKARHIIIKRLIICNKVRKLL